MTRDERITKLRKSRWIRYPRAEQILGQLEELLKHPKTHRMPNLLVFGETNNGKTALIQRFVQQHLPKLGDDRTLSRIPVVVIQAPPVPEERRFCQAILSQVFAPVRPSSSIEDLQHETLRMLVTINIKMLIIDEIHHVLAGPLLKQRHLLNVIKYMGNELQIPLVAAGTHDAFNAIQVDERRLSSTTREFRARPPAPAALEPHRSGAGDEDPDLIRGHDRRDLNPADPCSGKGD